MPPARTTRRKKICFSQEPNSSELSRELKREREKESRNRLRIKKTPGKAVLKLKTLDLYSTICLIFLGFTPAQFAAAGQLDMICTSGEKSKLIKIFIYCF